MPITIVDSGTDPTHPDFAGRPATTFLNDQTTTGPEEYHGTMVASIAAAPENGVDLAGVYPTAALQIFDASPDPRGISDLAAITGIETAAAHCPGVINLSFGSATPDPRVHDAILEAVHNGCLVVAAAGNFGQEGSPPVFPASWPHVFTVAATDEHDAVTPFSSISPANDIAAPGMDMIGDVPADSQPERLPDRGRHELRRADRLRCGGVDLDAASDAHRVAARGRAARRRARHRPARLRQLERRGAAEHPGLARRAGSADGSRASRTTTSSR